MMGIQSQVTSCANAAAQKAAAIALSGGPVRELKETLRVRRNALLDGLENLSGLSPLFPSAGFYIFVEVSPVLGFERKGKGKAPVDSASLANALLEEASVSLLPGSIFEAEGYLRLTFAPTPLSRIEEGVNRIRIFFASK
jgi:aspartate aminotransferase